MSGIANFQNERGRIVAAIACLLSLALATAALAADREANIDQSCDSSSEGSTGDGSTDDGSSDEGSTSHGENCSYQQRSIQQDAGDADRSVSQT